MEACHVFHRLNPRSFWNSSFAWLGAFPSHPDAQGFQDYRPADGPRPQEGPAPDSTGRLLAHGLRGAAHRIDDPGTPSGLGLGPGCLSPSTGRLRQRRSLLPGTQAIAAAFLASLVGLPASSIPAPFFRPSTYSRRNCPDLPEELICRLIRYQRPGFRPSWLLTSLTDTDLCTREELIDLYHRRWSIETIYREWKHSLDIQNLRSQTPRGILKEVYAQLMLGNLVRWTMTEALEGTDQTPVNLSFLVTLTLVRNAVGKIIRRRTVDYAQLSARLLAQIRMAKIRKRPGRSYPRPQDGKIKNKGHGKYQKPARIMRKSA